MAVSLHSAEFLCRSAMSAVAEACFGLGKMGEGFVRCFIGFYWMVSVVEGRCLRGWGFGDGGRYGEGEGRGGL